MARPAKAISTKGERAISERTKNDQNAATKRLNVAQNLERAKRFLEIRDYKSAHTECMNVLSVSPQEGEVFYLLGWLALDHSNYAKAIELFDRSITLGLQSAAPEAQAARCFLALDRKEEAAQRVAKAIELSPTDAMTNDTIGVVLSRIGRHDSAVPYYQKAITLQAENPDYQYNLGIALQFVGDLDGARSAFDECVRLNPKDTRARIARVSLRRQTESHNDIENLTRAWTELPPNNPDAALQLAHALAKSHEDLGDSHLAMMWLAKGKAQKRQHLPNREQEDAALFAAACSNLSSLKIEDANHPEGPVFIVGMPRTGTTLVDRILTTHPKIVSAGELSDFSIALKRTARTAGSYVLDADTLNAAPKSDLDGVGKTYLANVRSALGIEGRFTDKMPLNVFFAPAILAALPSARVICLRRHPADTVLSNYRQLFATGYSYYSYAYDLEQCAHYTVNFNKLINAYAAQLPSNRFRILEYETLATNFETETRNLLEFCDLEWDPACLDFHLNAAPVATASSVQVREPINTASIGRWLRYRPEIDSALAILAEAGLLSEEL